MSPIATSPDDRPPPIRTFAAHGTEVVLPTGLANRPLDQRRRAPIPVVNVHTLADGDDVVDFTAINADRAAEVGRERRCGLCGHDLGYWIGFLGGPESARSRAYTDPPMHPECAEAAVVLCPHIALQRARRANPEHLPSTAVVPDGFVETKPTEWVLGLTRTYRMRRHRGSLLFLPAPFKHLRRWRYHDGQLTPVQVGR